jgi:hypothetical protein
MVSVTGATSRLALVAAAGAVLAACSLLSNDPPVQACATTAEGVELADPASDFTLCIPVNWRDLTVGHPGWATIYGPDKSVEEKVADGSIAHFAVPLEPRDDDLLMNLTVYVRAVETGTSLPEVGDRYQKTLAGIDDIDLVSREDVALPSGPAIRFTSTSTRTKIGDRFLERRVAYVQVNAGRAYYFDFGGSDSTSEVSSQLFESIARSVRYLVAGAR